MSRWGNQIAKPVENAAATYLGCKLLGISGDMYNPVLGTLDAASQLAAASAVCSVATEAVHNWVLPQVASGDQIYSSASMLLNPLLQSSMLYMYANTTSPNKSKAIGSFNLLALGAGSEIVSSYVNDGFVQPWLNR